MSEKRKAGYFIAGGAALTIFVLLFPNLLSLLFPTLPSTFLQLLLFYAGIGIITYGIYRYWKVTQSESEESKDAFAGVHVWRLYEDRARLLHNANLYEEFPTYSIDGDLPTTYIHQNVTTAFQNAGFITTKNRLTFGNPRARPPFAYSHFEGMLEGGIERMLPTQLAIGAILCVFAVIAFLFYGGPTILIFLLGAPAVLFGAGVLLIIRTRREEEFASDATTGRVSIPTNVVIGGILCIFGGIAAILFVFMVIAILIDLNIVVDPLKPLFRFLFRLGTSAVLFGTGVLLIIRTGKEDRFPSEATTGRAVIPTNVIGSILCVIGGISAVIPFLIEDPLTELFRLLFRLGAPAVLFGAGVLLIIRTSKEEEFVPDTTTGRAAIPPNFIIGLILCVVGVISAIIIFLIEFFILSFQETTNFYFFLIMPATCLIIGLFLIVRRETQTRATVLYWGMQEYGVPPPEESQTFSVKGTGGDFSIKTFDLDKYYFKPKRTLIQVMMGLTYRKRVRKEEIESLAPYFASLKEKLTRAIKVLPVEFTSQFESLPIIAEPCYKWDRNKNKLDVKKRFPL
ncbi:MAG: hypothetical protein ACFFBD_14175 [Candidatus Hodarchaeota archaeon]